ncbi:MAG: winged helix DNA-binding domain-containing protein, partial [Ruaniaceae bacterium]|nr:winged helix DNA-binding domain-containing protein [Ruaniaceae bacterium]
MRREAARRLALRAQHLDPPAPPGPAGPARMPAKIRKLGLIQLDSVNVFARAHYMPLFSRLGPYDTAVLDRAFGTHPRRLVEQWGHMACVVPPHTHQLLAHRRRQWLSSDEARGNLASIERSAPGLVEEARRAVAEQGAMTATAFEAQHGAIPAKVPQMWSRTAGKAAFEHLWFAGEFATAARTAQFERVYDLTERVLPLREMDDDDARRDLTLRALRHLGIGTARCIADFYRSNVALTAQWLAALEAEGLAERVEVDGWRGP